MTSPGRGRIDWEAAFGYYASLGPVRTFGKVAKRFGVSDVAVGKHARLNGWDERLEKLDRELRRRVDETVVRDRAVRLQDSLELIDLARLQMLERLRSGEVQVDLGRIPELVKLEALLEGDPTDRIELGEVKSYFLAFATLFDSRLREVVVTHVPGEAGRALVTAVRRLLAQTLEETGQELAAGDEAP